MKKTPARNRAAGSPAHPDVRVVLVGPRNPLNIGAAARAMFNFGFHDLALVAPHEPVWQEARSAVGAERVLRSARVAPDLLSAIQDRTLVLGTSSLERRQLAQPTVSLDEAEEIIRSESGSPRLALLFGSEKTGLSNDDISHCHYVVRIPTRLDCPTMNLGQAVAVCCYEISRVWRHHAGNTRQPQAASSEETERLLDAIQQLVKGTRGPTAPSPGYKSRLRQVLLRSRLNSKDIELALGVLRDIAWQMGRAPH